MKTRDRSKIGLHAAEVVYALIALLWYVLPFVSPENLGGFNPLNLADTLFGSPPTLPVAWLLVTILVYVVPVISAWKIASIFLEKQVSFLADPDRALPIILNLVSSGIVVAMIVLHLVYQAHSAKYFAALPPLTYVVAALSIVFNGFFISMLIASNSRRDAAYREYLEFRRTSEEGSGGVLSVVQRQGIQRKLFLTFVPLILVIIFVLAFFLLLDFRRTILKAVDDNGKGLAERTGSVVKANPGDKDRISLDDYFAAESKKNEATAEQAPTFPFKTLSFYHHLKSGGFTIWASTNRKLINGLEPKDLILAQTTSLYNPVTESYEYRAPVTLGKDNIFIGYVMVDYARDVILEPFFRTQVKVIVIAALFMYASIFLIYLFGRNIVFPILFLRMSVNSIADKLLSMTKGKLRFSSELLQYNDRVRTRDEIHLLSSEVNHMTTVIRGVIPFISQSTLQHAGQETTKPEAKELAFLFTDIRGFTTLCEGMAPAKVVELLNHYLALQTRIIHENHGDVDNYVGDEIFARFEGTRKELNACKAGLEIRRAMTEEAQKASQTAGTVIDVGIGINTGEVTFGSVGAEDRKAFTAIGDNVNLAARLEGANKEYHTASLITEAVYERVQGEFLCREIDTTAVKGKSEGVRIFEILREKKGVTDRDERFKKLFETSLALYRKQKWESAEKGFAAMGTEYDDKTSEMFLGRISYFRKNPPPRSWDGVFRMTTK
jgi:class 3 adenylate cyclase